MYPYGAPGRDVCVCVGGGRKRCVCESGALVDREVRLIIVCRCRDKDSGGGGCPSFFCVCVAFDLWVLEIVTADFGNERGEGIGPALKSL